jgi:hypothetical protein
MRDRLLFQHGGTVQEGVWDPTDFKVSQRASGANMSVDVAAGFALIAADDPGNAGLYHQQNDATVNVPQPTAAHATLPRLDKLVLVITDTTDGGDASDQATLSWVTGAATSGTTLDNGNDGAHGAGTADVLVPPAATTMTTANIRDRRAWARGAYSRILRTAGDYTTTATGYALVDSANLQPRIECTGNPIRVTLHAGVSNSATPGNTLITFFVDGAAAAEVGSAPDNLIHVGAAAGYLGTPAFSWDLLPAAGSHLIGPGWRTVSGTSTMRASAASALQFTVEETLRPSANNT